MGNPLYLQKLPTMKNPRISKKEQGLLKGAIRRVFSRSDLRRKIIEDAIVDYSDPYRLRVKKWIKCGVCNNPTPKSYAVADHILPVIPVDSSFEEMSLDEVVNRMWCDPSNLQPICEDCHLTKSKLENKLRRENKKEKKNGPKSIKRPSSTNRKRNPSRGSKRADVRGATKARRLSPN